MKLAISIIIVSYNANRCLEACIESILLQGFKAYEIILIDNSSRKGYGQSIYRRYPQIYLIENNDNPGPCKARNQGITISKGEYILCLDHDTLLKEGFLNNVYNRIINDNHVGAIQPKVLRADGKTVYSKGIYPSFIRRFHDLGSGKIDKKESFINKRLFGVSSAAALYRKQALEDIREGDEYFDEDFFYVFEDVDLSWRMQNKGWYALYSSDAVCSHTAGRSRNRDDTVQYLAIRNRYYTIIKNESLAGLIKLPLVFLLYDIWRNLFVLARYPKSFIRASRDTFRQLMKNIRKRKECTT